MMDNIKKDLIISEFNKLIIGGKPANIKALLELKVFTLCEKMIIIDLFISYKLFITQGFLFNTNDCYEEIRNLNSSVLYVFNTNEDFFNHMYDDIGNILNNKKLKTKFNLEFYNIDIFIYLNIIAKSTYYIGHDHIDDDFCLYDGMLHRNIVLGNISRGIKVFKLLNTKIDIMKNTIKIMMCLAEKISQQKVIIRSKGKYKTNFYVKLNLISNLNYSDRLYINFSQIEMKNFNNYLIGASHLTLTSFVKKANHQLLKNNINCNAIIKLSKQPIYMEFMHWNFFKKSIIKFIKVEFNLNITDSATIQDIVNELSALRNDFEKQILEYKLKKKSERSISTKKIDLNYNDEASDENELSNKELDSVEKIDDEKKSDLNQEILNFTEEITEFNYYSEEFFKQKTLSIKGISRKIQQLYYILSAEKAKLLSYPIYLPHYYDFRGRVYPKSIIGFTYLKVLRATFKLPGFDKDVNYINLRKSYYFKKILNLEIAIDNRFVKSELSDIDKYFLIIHLLELGKYDKGRLVTSNGLSLQDLVNNGTKLYFNQEDDNVNIDDLIYMKIIKDNIINFVNNNKFHNITIIRDSTASFLQHWGIKLVARDEYINKLNLNGDIWYDAYTLVIDIFLNENIEYREKIGFKEIFKRNILKNFIMITNYNAGVYKCFSNLKEILIESKILFDEYELKIFSQKFHLFLKESLFNILFNKSKNEFLSDIGTLIHTDDKSNINLTYLKMKEDKEDIKIGKYRWVITRNVLIDSICDWKTQIALNANIIQASDAELARYLINRLDIQSVHDSFAINLYDLHKIVDLTNLFFNTKLTSKNYSIFILI